MHSLLEALGRRGWTVRRATGSRELLPPAVASRYASLPAEVLRFLSALDVCCSPDGTAWFLTAEDFARTAESGFRWNENEIMSLEAAKSDPAWQLEIRAFWDRHFPVMLAVHSDYDYLAVSLADGSVVHGFAPEFEDASPIAGSFAEFLSALEAEAASAEPRYPLAVFLGIGGR